LITSTHEKSRSKPWSGIVSAFGDALLPKDLLQKSLDLLERFFRSFFIVGDRCSLLHARVAKSKRLSGVFVYQHTVFFAHPAVPPFLADCHFQRRLECRRVIRMLRIRIFDKADIPARFGNARSSAEPCRKSIGFITWSSS